METVSLAKLGRDQEVMRQPLLLDGRNIYDAKELGELGFTYECIGK